MSVARYAPGSHFESCPAATGELDLLGEGFCRQFPDGAHRCGESRAPHRPHRCTCGAEWVALPPGTPEALAERLALEPDVPASLLHRPQHLAED